jgi:hypothetical protein
MARAIGRYIEQRLADDYRDSQSSAVSFKKAVALERCRRRSDYCDVRLRLV